MPNDHPAPVYRGSSARPDLPDRRILRATPGLSDRRNFIGAGGRALAALALAPPVVRLQPRFDLVIRGGQVLDGTGMPAYQADIGITGDRIASVGTIGAEDGRRLIDAAGLHVAPGFVDIHSHSDGDILIYPGADSRVRQGVTTELTGNCGGSAAPLTGAGAEDERRRYRESGVDAAWTGVASYCDAIDRGRVAVNQALLVGHGTIRTNAIGNVDRRLTPEELATCVRAVEQGMDEGAFGISTGLEYTPGRYTPAEEIVELARVVARRGGLYTSHVRNEETALLEAVDEAISIGRASGARVQVSHLKAAGSANWGKQQGALDLIASARESGIDVLADAYPYTAYSTGLTIFLSAAALEGGAADLIARLKDPAWHGRIRGEVDERVRRDPGDYSLIVISSLRTPANQALLGKNIVEVARDWRVEPVDAVLRLLEEERGSVSIIGHGMKPENVEMVLRHPLVMVGSDGSSMAPTGRAAESRPHPRSYGAFARVLAHYVRDRQALSLPQAVRKMTSMPADQ
ncbi:MAG: hypothetical protein EHM24_28480, partial [Acidobacteria bacterium]